MKSQKSYWNAKHSKTLSGSYSLNNSIFAETAVKYFSKGFKILELGCGLGRDSLFFAKKGFTVISTDLSKVAIKQNSLNFKNQKNLKFQVLDISKKLPFAAKLFDAVFARLSLHYFSDKITKNIFLEICRVLKAGGVLAFCCKSTGDELYGKGVELGFDMFLFERSTRHFFSKEYALDCLQDRFKVEKVWISRELDFGKKSEFVNVVARKI